jgi:AP2-like factor (ANT lineage)
LFRDRSGVVVSSSSPKLEDFLGASTAMALSLDSSSFYYGGGHGHHAHGHGHGHDQGGYLQPLQCAVIPGSGGHDVYGGHAQLVDEQSAAAMAASWYSARGGGGGGYDVNGAGAIVPLQGHPHPLALSMSSGTGSQSSSITMQVGGHADAVTEYVAMDGSKKRGGGGGQKQAVVHRKSIDTFGQRTSKYRGVTRYPQSPHSRPSVRRGRRCRTRTIRRRPSRTSRSQAAWFPPCKSRHRWTGRYEAHLWDNSCRKEGQSRKGRQGTRHCRHSFHLRHLLGVVVELPVLT